MMMPLFGLVQGLQPIVGFNYGARNMQRVKLVVRNAAAYATLHTFVAFVILMLCPRAVIALFSKDADLIEKGSHVIRVMVFCLPLVGFQVVGASMFQALGKAKPSLFLSMSRQLLFLVPLLLTLPVWFGLTGVWVSFPLADSLSCLVTAAWVTYQVRELNRQETALTP
jgi:Na+-driven multidrug efflux pump